ncbi:MAG: hypothetical protein KatS3mg042_1070 [Rhodothermaceae bacterium]|nr:MAG: hypothetical protein KatS3mg042_1070 [Rhodothermaceae bacterium]
MKYLNITRYLGRYTLALSLLVLTLGLTACDSDPNGDTPQVTLRIAAENAPAKGQSAIVIEEAKLLLKNIKFTPVSDDSTGREFKTGMIAVTLNLDGQPNEIAVGTVPPDTYKRITFKIHKPEDDETPPDPDFKEGTSGDQRFSVIVRGSKDGQPFTLKIRKSMDQRVELVPPLVIDETTGDINVTLLADLSRWFVDEQGRGLDPLNFDHHDAIADAIKDSFRALSVDD